MNKNWSDVAWERYQHWSQKNKRIVKRINELIKDIDRNGYTGIGKPEPLQGNLTGLWSRRIDEFNRLIYRIENDTIYIVYCDGHYDE